MNGQRSETVPLHATVGPPVAVGATQVSCVGGRCGGGGVEMEVEVDAGWSGDEPGGSCDAQNSPERSAKPGERRLL